ncbi:MAG: FecR family protein [Prolixibacteraceae bacterium]|nr:FecR family protein [Prolixibacteraceae bacterium]
MTEKLEQSLAGYSVPAKRTREEAWDMLQSNISGGKTIRKTKVASLNWFIGFASAAAVVFVILYIGMFRTGKYSPEISAGIAAVKTIEMPDGSNVQLNSNSNLKYHVNNFTGERNVVLNGDALFDVEKGGKFFVNFEGGLVKVKGTSFYISAYSSEMIRVDCTDGEVEVNLNGNNYLIGKNQGIKLYNGEVSGPFSVSEFVVNDRLNGVFYWPVISLSELADLIGYRFGYKAEIGPGLRDRNFSGRIELNNLHEGLLIISLAMELDYTIDEDKKLISINAN